MSETEQLKKPLNFWIVSNGRWTSDQLEAAGKALHSQRCGYFDGRRAVAAERWDRTDKAHRLNHYVAIIAAVEAIEKAGMKVEP